MKSKREEWLRPLVSRMTMVLLGLALLWGGIKCLRTAAYLREEYRQRVAAGEMPRTSARRTSRAGGAGLPMLIGGVLVTLGGGLAILGVLPLKLMQKIGIGHTTLHEQPDVHVGRMHRF